MYLFLNCIIIFCIIIINNSIIIIFIITFYFTICLRGQYFLHVYMSYFIILFSSNSLCMLYIVFLPLSIYIALFKKEKRKKEGNRETYHRTSHCD